MEQKVTADNPTFGVAHIGLAFAYWGKHKYPESIQEFRISADLLGDKNTAEFAAALDAGYGAGGWPDALRKGIEVSLAQYKMKTAYLSPYFIAELYADLGDKDHAFEWLNTAYQEHDLSLTGLRTDFTMDSPALRPALHRTGGQNRPPAVTDLLQPLETTPIPGIPILKEAMRSTRSCNSYPNCFRKICRFD
jgi:hypothetical protein